MPSSLGQPGTRSLAAVCPGAHALTNGRWSPPAGHGVLINSYTPSDRFAAARARRPARGPAVTARRLAQRLVA